MHKKYFGTNNFVGFTIIEMMIAVATLGVLATLAMSSWDQLQKRTLRSEAKEVLYQISLDQQQYRAKNSTFNINYPLPSTYQTKFTLQISAANSTTFRANLTLKPNQERIDPDCKSYTITINGGKLTLTSAPSRSCL